MKKLFLLIIALVAMSFMSTTGESNAPTKGTPITFHGKTFHTVGELPKVGSQMPNFTLTDGKLQTVQLKDFKGKKLLLNIFPSLDTPVCSQSVRTFNKDAAALTNTKVLCISKDLPFAQARFCSANAIENVETLSDFRTDFGKKTGVQIADGPLAGLLSRAVIVLDENGKVIYTEQVSDIGHEPNYSAALNALK